MALRPILVTIKGKTQQFKDSMKESIKLINSLAATQKRLARQRVEQDKREIQSLSRQSLLMRRHAEETIRTIKKVLQVRDTTTRRSIELTKQFFNVANRLRREENNETKRATKEILRLKKERQREAQRLAKEAHREVLRLQKEEEKATREAIRIALRDKKNQVEEFRKLEKKRAEEARKLIREEARERRKARDMITVGRAISGRVTSPIVGIFGQAFKDFEEFERQMVNATSIMDVTIDQGEKMREVAKELSREWRTSATDIARSYVILASAGQRYSDLIDKQGKATKNLTSLVQFAVAAQMDLETATQLLIDSTASLGLKASSYLRVANSLVIANQLAQASVEDYAYALRTELAGTLRVMNIEIEEGMALLAAYAQVGFRGAAAGRLASRFVRLLMQTSVTASEGQRKLGFSVFDTNKKFIGFSRAARELERLLTNTDDATRAYILDMLGFKAKTQAAALPLIKMADVIDEFHFKIKDAGKVVEEVTKKQMAGFAAKMDLYRNSVEEANINVGKSWQGVVKMITSSATFLLKVFSSLPQLFQQIITSILTLTSAIGPAIIGVGLFSLAWKAIEWKKIGLAIKALTAQVISARAAFWSFHLLIAGAAAFGIIQIIGAISGLSNKLKELTKGLDKLRDHWKFTSDNIEAGTKKLSSELRKQADNIRGTDEQREKAKLSLISTMDRERAKIKELQKSLARSKKFHEDEIKVMREGDGLFATLSGGFRTKAENEVLKMHEDALVAMDEQNKAYELRLELLDEVKKKMEAAGILVDPFAQEEFSKFNLDMIKKFKELGLESDRAKVFDFEARGIDSTEIKAIIELLDTIDKKEEAIKNARSLGESLKSITEELDMFRAQEHGAFGDIPEDLQKISFLLKTIKDDPRTLKFLGKEELENIKRMEAVLPRIIAQRKHMTLLEEGKSILEGLESPIEKVTRKLDKLNEVFQAGGFAVEGVGGAAELKLAKAMKAVRKEFEDEMGITTLIEETTTPLEEYERTVKKLHSLLKGPFPISQELFQRGMQAAKDKLDEATESTKKLKQELQSLNAVLSGSNEHWRLLLNQMDMLRDRGDKKKAPLVPIPPANVGQDVANAVFGAHVGFGQKVAPEIPQEAKDIGNAFGDMVKGIFKELGGMFNRGGAPRMAEPGIFGAAGAIGALQGPNAPAFNVADVFAEGFANAIPPALNLADAFGGGLFRGIGNIPGAGNPGFNLQDVGVDFFGRKEKKQDFNLLRRAFDAIAQGANPGSFYTHDTHAEQWLKAINYTLLSIAGIGGSRGSLTRPSVKQQFMAAISRGQTRQSLLSSLGGGVSGSRIAGIPSLSEQLQSIIRSKFVPPRLQGGFSGAAGGGTIGIPQRFGPPSLGGGFSGAAGGSTVGIPLGPQSNRMPVPASEGKKQTDILERMERHLSSMARQPQITIKGAGLT